MYVAPRVLTPGFLLTFLLSRSLDRTFIRQMKRPFTAVACFRSKFINARVVGIKYLTLD